VAADRRAVGRRQVAETELVEPKEAVLDELRLERRARRLAIRRTGTVHDPGKEVARRRARASPFAHYLYRALVLDGIDDSAGAHRQPTAVAQLLDQCIRFRRHAVPMDLPERTQPGEEPAPLAV